jgi:hypothetical protein
MTIRNCIGWGASGNKGMGNHEFLSEDKEGSQVPYTDYNSWTTLDGCNPYKEGQKVANGSKPVTKNYSGEFLSLSVADFMADRMDDGSLPDNNFARLKPGSIFKDLGTPIIGFTPTRKMTEAECAAAGLEYITADDLYIPYNDAAPEFGAFELDGVPVDFTIPEKISLVCTTANSMQEITEGQPIEDIIYEWNEAGTTALVKGLAEGLSYSTSGHTLTISGTPTSGCMFTVTVSGNTEEGVKPVTSTGTITLVKPFRVLTGDWYHFQDTQDNLPADLKASLQLINGDNTDATKAATTIDPTKAEADAQAAGYSIGAVNLGQSNGGIKLTLNEGALQIVLNTFFTGGRTFQITYTLADGTTTSVTTSKYSKGAYVMDVLALAGLTSDTECLKVRSITFSQSGANGGTRIYDMYVRVPDTSGTTGIATMQNAQRTIHHDYYNLKGQRVNDSYKGIVILRGKKIVKR